MRACTVYQVIDYDGIIRHYHFGSVTAARAFVRELKAQNNRNKDLDPPQIHPLRIALNAQGVAKALDDFVSYTCANEG